MNKRKRLELHLYVKDMLEHFMINNGVSFTEMEDALNNFMVIVKDNVYKELLLEQQELNNQNENQESEEIVDGGN